MQARAKERHRFFLLFFFLPVFFIRSTFVLKSHRAVVVVLLEELLPPELGHRVVARGDEGLDQVGEPVDLERCDLLACGQPSPFEATQ